MAPGYPSLVGKTECNQVVFTPTGSVCSLSCRTAQPSTLDPQLSKSGELVLHDWGAKTWGGQHCHMDYSDNRSFVTMGWSLT